MTMLLAIGATAAIPVTDGPGYKVGDTATDFSLKATDGNTVTLSEVEATNGYIVVFTCNSCPYSVMYEDRIISLAAKAAEMGFALVAINPNDPEVKPEDSFDAMMVRSKEKAFNFPYLFDEGQKVYPAYGATKTPHVYVMDKEMTVQYIGAIDDNARDAAAVQAQYVVGAMKAISKGSKPEPAMTKAIGCSIKTKA